MPILYTINDLNIYIQSLTLETIEQQNTLSQKLYYHQLNEIEDILIVISSFVYAYLSLKLIFAYGKKVNELNIKPAKPVYLWLKKLIAIMLLITVFLLINELIDFYYLENQHQNAHWRWFNIFLACAIYYLAFKGYKVEATGISQKHLKTVEHKITKRQNELIQKNLTDLLEKELIYLNPELTLKETASQIDVSSESLSFVINQKFNMNFRDLINSYRVKSVKSKLNSIDSNQSILDIALDSGFNSQASFYRAFKKFENMTPKAYLASKS